MADTLCGPSNALQQFSKHSTVDRTLQQDRLHHRSLPTQGFRSSPGPNAGHLDPEFEAFQRDFNPAIPPPEVDHFAFAGPITRLGPSTTAYGGPSNWAADFQRLHVSDLPKPIPQHQFRTEAPLHRSATSNRHQDFLQSTQRSSHHHTPVQQYPTAHNHAGFYQNGFGPQSQASHRGADTILQPSETRYESQAQQVEDSFDDAAFERAFEVARTELEQDARQDELDQSRQAQQEALSLGGERLSPAEAENVKATERIGSDTIASREDAVVQHDEADELARTAGHLLENLRDNQTSKFQQSSFLSLMRRLRDREVRVDGDNIVEGQSPPSMETGVPTPVVAAGTEAMEPAMTGAIQVDEAIGTTTAFTRDRIDLLSHYLPTIPSITLSPLRHSRDGPSVSAVTSRHLKHHRSEDEDGSASPPPPFLSSPSSPNLTAIPPPSLTSPSSSRAASPSPPPFSSLYFSPLSVPASYAAAVTAADPHPIFALTPATAPSFEQHLSAHSTVVAETKAALPADTKLQSSSTKPTDDGEPPPPYTEGSSPLESFTFLMARAGEAASIITQVQQSGPPPINTLGDVGADENINLDLRGTRFTLSRDELLTLPEFVLLSLFPNGLLPDGHMNSFSEGDIYPVDYDPASLQYMLEFFRNVAQTIPSRSPSPTGQDPNAVPVEPMPGSAREMLQDRAGIIVLREDLDFYVIQPRPDVEQSEMIEVKRAAGKALLRQDGIFSGLRRSDEPGTTEQHLIEMLTAGGFNPDDRWGHRAGEPNKAVVCSLALARLRTDIKGTDMANSNAVGMAQKLLLFWRKPARRCWWEGVELDDVEGVEGRLKVWIRRVWTLEMSVIGLR
ncbi:MAG: hypothetical protein M1817_001584 [Caeruleum heppii]|nr:MAG: hypothetical protein M1817_001584 [Caeruleum heppii]